MTRSLRILSAILMCFSLTACKTDLYSGLSEREANEMIAIMQRAGLSVARHPEKSGTLAVQVEQTQFAEAVELLRSHGYPKDRYVTLGDVFEGNGFVASQTEERARFIYAMSEELSRTISEVNGVLSARVHVVLPTTDPLSRDSTPSSASVFIRYSDKSDITELLPQIKVLVANSIEGLSYDKVSVGFVAVNVLDTIGTPVDLAPATAVSDDDLLIFGALIIAFVGVFAGGLHAARRVSRRKAQSQTFVAIPAE
ncbi:MAG: type III secretion inner membrane ring lipoprotein SctJ [Pseudomonadota bacterium]